MISDGSEPMAVCPWDRGWEVEHTPSLASLEHIALGSLVAGWDTGCWLLREAALGPYNCDTIMRPLPAVRCVRRLKLVGAHGILFNPCCPTLMLSSNPPSYGLFQMQALNPVTKIRLKQGS